jgi:hypothetical protein
VLEELDDRHLAAEVPEDRRELAADHASAQHDQALRELRDRQQPRGVDAARVVDAVDRGPRRRRAGGDDAVLEADALGALDREGVRPVEAAAALHELDAVGLQQAADVLDDVGDDPVLVGLHLAEVQLRALHLDAEAGEGLLRVLHGVRALDPGLGRDAADVQARASHRALLDHGDRETELAGADGGRISSGTRSEHGDVDVHSSSLGGDRRRRQSTRGSRGRAAGDAQPADGGAAERVAPTDAATTSSTATASATRGICARKTSPTSAATAGSRLTSTP